MTNKNTLKKTGKNYKISGPLVFVSDTRGLTEGSICIGAFLGLTSSGL